MYYKQTKEGEGWPEVEVGGERGRVERGNILAQGGAHRGKTHRCRDWNWGVILIAESGESSKTLKHET